MRSLHGTHVHGFPNMLLLQMTQGANLISNVPHNFVESSRTVAMIVKHALDNGHREVEVTADAEQAWVDLLLTGPGTFLGTADCTPGYYNNEGQDSAFDRAFFVGYPQGAMAYFAYLDEWRSTGTFDGLEFR